MATAMDKPALLVLVRHGESLMNIVKKNNIFLPEETAHEVRGLPDHKIPLINRGIWQAETTSSYLREKFGVFDAVYDSGYMRTRQTREGLLKAYTPEEMALMKIRTSHLIRERENGYTFDMTTEEAEMHFPWLKHYFDTFGRFYARPPGGQSQADLCDQVFRFLGLVFKHRAGQKVMAVTHGHTLRAFRFNLEKWTADDYIQSVESGEKFDNCGVTVYRFNENNRRLELETLNQVYWK